MKTQRFVLLALLVCNGNLASGISISIYETGFQSASAVPSRSGSYWDGVGLPFMAQQFSLDEGAQIDGAQIWTYDTLDGSAGRPIAIQYSIFTGQEPCSQLVASGVGAITSLPVILGSEFTTRFSPDSGFHTIATTFSLSEPILLEANTTYWFALSCLVNPNNVSGSAAWGESGSVDESFVRQNGDGWDVIQGGRAFALYGSAIAEGAPANVPDGSRTMPMLLLGCGVCWLIRRTARQ